jgi:hypothetical protein
LSVVDIFIACHGAVRDGILVRRANRQDKEFHFQDWFGDRLRMLQIDFDTPGRNAYPDFRLVHSAEGYEIKGLAYPGREANYDSNSQVPTGYHNGREVFYIFGRYPADPDGSEYPVIDLVMCHGDFLNADHDYEHENKNIKGFGSYGDIMIRDRKMYVAPTPFALTEGTTGQVTLILPVPIAVNLDRLTKVGDLTRTECQNLVVGYSFDLKTNQLTPNTIPNPDAGQQHVFGAYRALGQPGPRVQMRVALVQGN